MGVSNTPLITQDDPIGTPVPADYQRPIWHLPRWLVIAVTSVVGPGILLGAWWLVSAKGIMSPILLPSPANVATTGWGLVTSGALLVDTEASMGRVLLGFVLAMGIGVPLAFLMGSSRVLRGVVNPLIELVRPVPPIAVIPLAMLWFGIGETSKVVLIAYGAFFPVLINSLAGFMAIEVVHIRAIRSLGATQWQVFRHVILRSTFPYVVVGARMGMAMGFIVLVAAELIAADSGLGFLIQQGRLNFETNKIFVGIIVIGVLGLVLNQGMLSIEKRVVRWRFLEESRDG